LAAEKDCVISLIGFQILCYGKENSSGCRESDWRGIPKGKEARKNPSLQKKGLRVIRL
jgi:hypothetical protein